MEGSRSYIQSLIKGGHVTVGGKVGKLIFGFTPDTVIHVGNPQSLNRLRLNLRIFPLDYLYEDHDIVIVNKTSWHGVAPCSGKLFWHTCKCSIIPL